MTEDADRKTHDRAVDEISTAPHQNGHRDADDHFDADIKSDRHLGEFQILIAVFLGDLGESAQFLGFLDKSLDDPDTGKGLLGEVVELVELLLSFFPLVRHDLLDPVAPDHQCQHRQNGDHRKDRIQTEHFI